MPYNVVSLANGVLFHCLSLHHAGQWPSLWLLDLDAFASSLYEHLGILWLLRLVPRLHMQSRE